MSVVLYSTGCPKCNVLKKKMDAKQILYEEVNSVDTMLSIGIKQVPVLKVGDDLYDFPQANDWINQQ